MIYNFADPNLSVVLTNEVLKHFGKHQQKGAFDLEAGGQLFARFEDDVTIIKKVTGPRPTDKRTRVSYQPDRRAEQKEILRLFKKDLHYVGDWHTHPSSFPQPSGTDISNTKSCVLNSVHQLKGFVMVIVGTTAFPASLRVSVHDGAREYLLKTNAEKVFHIY